MASFSLNVTFVYDSAELFHNDGAVQFRLGEPVVRITLGLPDQTLRSDAVLVFQQVVDILHPLLAQTLVQLPVAGILVGRADQREGLVAVELHGIPDIEFEVRQLLAVERGLADPEEEHHGRCGDLLFDDDLGGRVAQFLVLVVQDGI